MTDVLLFLSYTAAGWVRITLGLLLVWLLLSSRRPGPASLGLALAGGAALALLPPFFLPAGLLWGGAGDGLAGALRQPAPRCTPSHGPVRGDLL